MHLSWLKRAGLIAILALMPLLHPPPAEAAVNAATGGIGGINNGTLANGDGSGGARITLFSVDPALVKQARDLTGTVLPSGASVSPGQTIWFVLTVDNATGVDASDVRLTDQIDETQFTYVPGSLEQTIVPTGSGDAAIWAGSWTPLTDNVGVPDDAASAVDTGGPAGADRITVGAETVQTNQNVIVPASSLRAFRFQVQVR